MPLMLRIFSTPKHHRDRRSVELVRFADPLLWNIQYRLCAIMYYNRRIMRGRDEIANNVG